MLRAGFGRYDFAANRVVLRYAAINTLALPIAVDGLVLRSVAETDHGFQIIQCLRHVEAKNKWPDRSR